MLAASESSLCSEWPALVLLHWGDFRVGKGRRQVLALVQALLDGHLAAGDPRRWLFHHCSSKPLPPEEQQLLTRAERELPGFQLRQGPVSHEAMQQVIARTAVALFPYCPSAYAERSSSVLWCYAAARLASGLPAQAVGCSEGFLAQEAQALGLGWQALPDGENPPHAWYAAIEQALSAHPSSFSAYGRQVLGPSNAHWQAYIRLHKPNYSDHSGRRIAPWDQPTQAPSPASSGKSCRRHAKKP